MRSLLEFIMGRKRATPAHVQEAIDASLNATDATVRAKEAVDAYWEARADTRPVRILTQYERAERDRRRRIAR